MGVPIEVIKDCIERPSKVSLSDDQHSEVVALKLPIAVEEAGFKSLILDKNKLGLEQNVSNSSELYNGTKRSISFFPSLFQILNTLVNYTNCHILKLEGAL